MTCKMFWPYLFKTHTPHPPPQTHTHPPAHPHLRIHIHTYPHSNTPTPTPTHTQERNSNEERNIKIDIFPDQKIDFKNSNLSRRLVEGKLKINRFDTHHMRR